MMRAAPAVLAIATLVASSFVPRVAAAQASAQDQAVAQSLYDEGKKLMGAGNFAGACPKLEESQRLDPTPVTEFYLADCYERAGRTASAWTTFLDLAATEHANGGPKAVERERVARDRAGALEPRLAQIIVDVPAAARVAGLVVKRDGEVVRDGQWGVPIAVDPGKHSIEASAPGKKTWTTTQEIAAAGGKTTVSVEALVDLPAAIPGAPGASGVTALPSTAPAGDEPHAASPLRTVGLVVAGVGAAALVTGTVFGVMALSKSSDANSGHCGGALGGANQCDATGVGLRNDAVSFGNVSTVAIIAGGVLAAGGVTLWLVAPKGAVQAGPAVGVGTAGMMLRGIF